MLLQDGSSLNPKNTSTSSTWKQGGSSLILALYVIQETESVAKLGHASIGKPQQEKVTRRAERSRREQDIGKKKLKMDGHGNCEGKGRKELSSVCANEKKKEG